MTSYQSAREVSLWSLTWAQLVCLAFLRLPRLVPRVVLPYTTSTSPPHPQVIHLPSREPGRTIYCWLFVPPQDSLPADGRTPLHIDFHGGGFITGQLAEQAPFCSLVSRRLGAVVLTVDYRMGPLSKYPAAIHDAEDVARACVDESWEGFLTLRHAVNDGLERQGRASLNLERTRLSVSGFSSGGNLALNLLVSAPGWPTPLDVRRHPHDIPALLFYPSLDSRQLPSERPLPAGMKRSSGWLRWLGSVMSGAYLERWQAGELRASPGLVSLHRNRAQSEEDKKLVDVVRDEGDGHGKQGSETAQGQAAREGEDSTLHPLSHSLLILPSQDSLAHQSGVWVEALEGAGRLVGGAGSSRSQGGSSPSATGDATLGVTPLRIPGAPHGWTQFPDFALTAEQRRQKYDVFEQSIDFVERVWRSA